MVSGFSKAQVLYRLQGQSCEVVRCGERVQGKAGVMLRGKQQWVGMGRGLHFRVTPVLLTSDLLSALL